jgi:formylglycine-generating enzyme required for sulfatase activity
MRAAILHERLKMGACASEAGRDKDERPQHRVTVPTFAVGRYALEHYMLLVHYVCLAVE